MPLPAKASPTAKTPPPAKKPVEPTDQELLQGFNEYLAPFGKWSDHDRFGQVWVPSEKEVGKNFFPYRTGGRWAVTEGGDWAWVSKHKWGRVPVHYGRWAWDKDKKWMWVPGTDHAPAHVAWRVADAGYNFVGWAPLAPEKEKNDKGELTASRKQMLPFTYVRSARLFSPNLDRHTVREPKLGAEIQNHSRTFAPSSSDDGEVRAASPTFGQVRVPPYAIPRTRVPALLTAIAPIEAGFFAPPVEAKPTKAVTKPAAPTPVEKPKTEAAGEAPAEKAGEGAAKTEAKASLQDDSTTRRFATPPGSKKSVRYKCWWTKTRPRVWRCGY
ncbi:MAG: DUF6600 domain-containing protein [Myxococcota bacterium]